MTINFDTKVELNDNDQSSDSDSSEDGEWGWCSTQSKTK
jgi:hypothetical protein